MALRGRLVTGKRMCFSHGRGKSASVLTLGNLFFQNIVDMTIDIRAIRNNVYNIRLIAALKLSLCWCSRSGISKEISYSGLAFICQR